MTDSAVVARWESRSGKHWVEVTANGCYQSPGAGGCRATVADTIAHVEELVNMGGYFQPDDAKTPMRRTR